MRRWIALLLLLAAGDAGAQQWDLASASAMVAAMDHAATHGLPPARYGRQALAEAVKRGDVAASAALADRGFRALAADLLAGASPAAARRAWHLPAQSASAPVIDRAMGQGLASGDLVGALDALAPRHPDYSALRKGLALEPPGPGARRDAILASLERWRWMPRGLGSHYLWVNVPAFEAQFVATDGGGFGTRVIVGKKRTPTPQFAAMVSGVILNPEWVVPKSIQAEGVARMMVTDPRGAAAKGYRKTATGITQGPGPHNQLGQVKLKMPNPWSIYLHDTPAKALFDRKVRAFSHGCIRTQNILGLAERLLVQTPGWDRAAIDAAVAAGKTVEVGMVAAVPVYVVYFTAEPDKAGGLRIHPDLYGRDAPVLRALAAGGEVSGIEAAGKEQAAGAEGGQHAVEFVGCKSEAAVAAADLAVGAGH
jgi:murein L,D-transpeptidase YcbB/YkuD